MVLIQPSLQPPGGGHGVAAWMLEALRGHHELAVLTWTPLDFREVNRFYGTSLRLSDVKIERVPWWMAIARGCLPSGGDLLKHALLWRAAAAATSKYDVLLTANNEVDLGRRSIQYIHYPHFAPRPSADLRRYHAIPLLLPLYYSLSHRVSGFSPERMKRNVTLANSDWTGRLVQRLHGIVPRTVYPPIATQFPEVSWEQRHEGFLCVGRLAPEKDLDRVIEVVSGVRRAFPRVTLCFVGTPGPSRYQKHIEERVRAAGDWISLRQNVSREELLALMPTYRYGIHGMPAEHFGMAPAEMAAAGCIVFVPNDGGQVEIVGNDRRLVYETVDGAVAQIGRVLSNPDEQQRLREMLKSRSALFSVERFISVFREIVDAAARS